MTFTYDLCQMLIENGRVEQLQEKLDVFFSVDRLTKEQYTSLSKALTDQTAANVEKP